MEPGDSAQVQEWLQDDLLDEPDRPGLGAGKGRGVDYNAGLVEQAVEIGDLVRRHRSYDTAVVILFQRGHYFDNEARLRAAFTALLDRAREEVVTAANRALRKQRAAPDDSETPVAPDPADDVELVEWAESVLTDRLKRDSSHTPTSRTWTSVVLAWCSLRAGGGLPHVEPSELQQARRLFCPSKRMPAAALLTAAWIVDVPEVDSGAAFDPAELVERRVYSWDDLAQLFGFEPGWLNRMGGMGSLPRHDAVLIISHPGGGKSFDYDDYWDGPDLIYTGHGQQGDQQRTGTNRYVGDNLRTLLVFEQAGPAQLRYVGSPVCVDEWPETALDRDGNDRRVIRFCLRFETDAPLGGGPAANGTRAASADPERRPRPFDRSRPPRPRSSNGRGRRRDPAETAALQEKAVQAHHKLVSTVNDALLAAGWTDVGEIPAAIDLWGRSPDGARTIFEMKTLRPASELGRIRGAIAQLLEYRYFFGAPEGGPLRRDRPPIERQARAAIADARYRSAGDRRRSADPGLAGRARTTPRTSRRRDPTIDVTADG